MVEDDVSGVGFGEGFTGGWFLRRQQKVGSGGRIVLGGIGDGNSVGEGADPIAGVPPGEDAVGRQIRRAVAEIGKGLAKIKGDLSREWGVVAGGLSQVRQDDEGTEGQCRQCARWKLAHQIAGEQRGTYSEVVSHAGLGHGHDEESGGPKKEEQVLGIGLFPSGLSEQGKGDEGEDEGSAKLTPRVLEREEALDARE